MDSYTEAESEMSFKIQIILAHGDPKDATKDSDKHYMSSTLRASVFMAKNYSDNLHFIKKTEDLTMKQMFDISEKLISEQSDEIFLE